MFSFINQIKSEIGNESKEVVALNIGDAMAIIMRTMLSLIKQFNSM